jgi:hypothetical protein
MEDGRGKQKQALTRQVPKLFLVFCIVAIIIVAVAAVSTHGPPEPVYEGVRLSKWLGGDVPTPLRIGDVFSSIGPEALPWLVNALPRLEFEQRYEAWLQKLTQKSPVAHRLLRKLAGPHKHRAYFNACMLLASLAPGSAFETKALRTFTRRRPADDTTLIKLQLWALGRFTNSPEKAIPILVSQLTNTPASEVAISSLANFGSQATPQLYPLALDKTRMTRPAEEALERADPLAYKRLREEKEKRKSP